MELIHAVSDFTLCITALYVFFTYLMHLELSSTILWESFVLSVAASSFFGCLSFLGYDNATSLSIFFQKIAITAGSVGLVAASCSLAAESDFKKWQTWLFLALGFTLFVLYEIFDFKIIYDIAPLISMITVFILGLFATAKGRIKSGVWLMIAVCFFALANFRKEIFREQEFVTSLYHLLNAAGILSIGMANAPLKHKLTLAEQE